MSNYLTDAGLPIQVFEKFPAVLGCPGMEHIPNEYLIQLASALSERTGFDVGVGSLENGIKIGRGDQTHRSGPAKIRYPHQACLFL